MSTVNGCGTMFYGWRGRATPASTATKWITLFFLPIAPLGRYRLTPITDFDREMLTASAKEVAAALVGHGARTDISLISARLPIRFPEVLSTYFTAFVAVPFLMVWPWLLLPGEEALRDTSRVGGAGLVHARSRGLCLRLSAQCGRCSGVGHSVGARHPAWPVSKPEVRPGPPPSSDPAGIAFRSHSAPRHPGFAQCPGAGKPGQLRQASGCSPKPQGIKSIFNADSGSTS